MKSLLAFLSLAACSVGLPTTGRYDFTPSTPELASAILDAAELWHAAGVDVASLVSVDTSDGVPVVFETAARVPVLCDGRGWHACVTYTESGGFDRVIVADDLSAERLAVVLAHELMHVLVPRAQHLDPALPGILHPNGTGGREGPTAHDMDEVCSHTSCEVTP